MFVHHYEKQLAQRLHGAEWLMLGCVLVLSGLLIGYLIWHERSLLLASNLDRLRPQALIIDEHLGHRLEGVRGALDGLRESLRPGANCPAECRRTLLQALKRALPGVRAQLVLDSKGAITADSGGRILFVVADPAARRNAGGVADTFFARSAPQRDVLRLRYQPVPDSAGSVTGVELLLRCCAGSIRCAA